MDAHLFLLADDYHLGDLLWLTVVLDEYRRKVVPEHLIVGCPDRPVNRILERVPAVDELLLGRSRQVLAHARARYGVDLTLVDLRPFSLATGMLRDIRYRLPWLYFRDLWLRERGQWLATYLRLGRLRRFRPLLALRDEDRETASRLPRPYVAIAPHVGRYAFPPFAWWWHRLKSWQPSNWERLAELVRRSGREVVTLGAAGQDPIPGTRPILGLPIGQVAGVIEGADALISAESGLWYLAAACETPFVVVPWWLPRGVDWAAPMEVPHRLVRQRAASAGDVFALLQELLAGSERTRSA